VPRRNRRSVGFTLTAGSGVTPIPLTELGGLCTECQGRIAFVELRKTDQDVARRLCSECLFKELAPPQQSLSEVAERAAQELSEAERTETAEQLWRRAEFLDEWWTDQEEPMPSALAEIVARHLKSAPSNTTPLRGGVAGAVDVRTARLALLVMRGSLCERTTVNAEGCIVDSNMGPVPYSEAAELLARMPKPLECRARARGDVMAVRCRPITEPSQLAARRDRNEYWDQRGGHYTHLRREYGERYPHLKLFVWGSTNRCSLPLRRRSSGTATTTCSHLAQVRARPVTILFRIR
jgi:hypothetical protein